VRAAAPIPAKIAEGRGRNRGTDKWEYPLLLARELGCLEQTTYSKLVNSAQEVGRMLSSLLVRVRMNP
jgi:hypothetical protein